MYRAQATLPENVLYRSDWKNVMVYGSNEPVQLANKDRTIYERDVVSYVYPVKVDTELMLRAFYNNVATFSTSIWRLSSRSNVPWMPKDTAKALFGSVKTKVPRRLVATKFSVLFPLYNKSSKIQTWWQSNAPKVHKKGGGYLNSMIGGIGRSLCVSMFIEHDAPLAERDVEFILDFHRMLGYPDDENFYTRFATPVYLSNVVGKTLKDKAKVIATAPKHLRNRIALMNDEKHSLADCVRVAEAVGCRVALHVNNYVKHDGGSTSLKDKLVQRAVDTTRANKGSSGNLFVVLRGTTSKKLVKYIEHYAKIGSIVIER